MPRTKACPKKKSDRPLPDIGPNSVTQFTVLKSFAVTDFDTPYFRGLTPKKCPEPKELGEAPEINPMHPRQQLAPAAPTRPVTNSPCSAFPGAARRGGLIQNPPAMPHKPPGGGYPA